jgi:plastocyanin
MQAMTKLLALIAALALAAFGLAACGGDDDDETTPPPAETEATTPAGGGGGGGGGGTISFEADPGGELAYTQTEVTGPAGSDTIDLVNDSSVPHDVTIEDSGGNQLAQTETITGDSTSTTATLDPGTYTFYCSVDGHREAGMEGTLTIE